MMTRTRSSSGAGRRWPAFGVAFAGAPPVAGQRRVGRRNTPTPAGGEFVPTPGVARTATPGGVLSVWVVTPADGSAPQADNVTPNATVPGSRPVGPAATATAAFATIEAATAVAAAPPPAPYYQPDECPPARAPSPPTRPANFNDYKDRIAGYLSAGGSPTVLEATLRNWGAINDAGGVVQADTDLTGDGCARDHRHLL